MSADHLPCGDSANESERIAIEYLLAKLRGLFPHHRWLLLSNVPSAANDRAIPDEIDLVCIGSTGFFVIEVKHWDRAYLKSNQTVVLKEATKLNDKVRRVVTKLRRAGVDPGFVAGRFLLTREGVSRDKQPRPEFHGCKFYGLSDWKQLLDVDSGTTFDDAAIQRACRAIQPLSKVALSGDIRRIADLRNLELQSQYPGELCYFSLVDPCATTFSVCVSLPREAPFTGTMNVAIIVATTSKESPPCRIRSSSIPF